MNYRNYNWSVRLAFVCLLSQYSPIAQALCLPTDYFCATDDKNEIGLSQDHNGFKLVSNR